MIILSLNMRGWGDRAKRRHLRSLISTGNFNFICLQETKREILEENQISQLWGNLLFEYVVKPANGQSGGLLSSWVAGSCDFKFSFMGTGFIGVALNVDNSLLYVVNVYAPCYLNGKRQGWEELKAYKQSLDDGDWCLVGDFNCVTRVEERKGIGVRGSIQEVNEFNAFISDMDLLDVSVTGNVFSWFCSDGISMSRLDRFLISPNLVDKWNISGQWIGKRNISDHCPIWLLRSNVDWGPKPFRFVNAWFHHAKFKEFVKDSWSQIQVSGNKAYVFKEKMKMLKEKLRVWNKEVFGVVDLNIEEDVKELNNLDQMLIEHWDEATVSKRKEVSVSFWKQIRLKESILHQKSRARWIKEGDVNSKYFHSMLKFKKRKNILKLLDDEGRLIEDVFVVKDKVKNFFQNGFTEPLYGRPVLNDTMFNQISSEANDYLVMPFEEEEIREGIWSCDGDKSPGPDGFNLRFFKENWDLLKYDIVGVFSEFYAKAHIPKAFSASFLTLIPKNDHPQGLGEYRPICLIGSIYKILSKVLANRLKKVLLLVISECQSAFLGGRNILDGVVIVNELVDLAKRNKEECMLFKVDFEKAYDTVSWSFLFDMLAKFGFDLKWIRWIRACVSSSSLSVLVNGSPTQDFLVQRGLRQGDPLSPFLFLLVAEGLARLVDKAVGVGVFEGFVINENLSYSLVQFADDTVLIGKPSWNNLWGLKSILRSFELVSGLKVNFIKSKLIGINVPDNFMEQASVFLHCRAESIPFNFLGLPVGANPRRKGTWNPVLQKFRSRLASWKGRNLSIGGRVTLINSVLSSLPLYFFSFYKAPKVVIREMIKIQRDFLWGVKEDARGMYWVAWDKVCREKNEGGLGIKNLENFNISLLSKWKWRCLVDENANWRGLLSHRYGELSGFMSSDSVRSMRSDSLWWRDLCIVGKEEMGDDWFKDCIRRGLGSGEGVKLWKHHWIGHQPLSIVFPNLFAGCADKDLTVAEAGCWRRDVWSWNFLSNVAGCHLCVQEAAELADILREVSPIRGKSDCWKWILTHDKMFSVSSCYIQVQSVRQAAVLPPLLSARIEAVWQTVVPSKIKLFGWRMFVSALPLRSSLLHRNVIQSMEEAACAFCQNDFEDLDHLFVGCDLARMVWKKVEIWLGVDHIVEESLMEHFDSFAKVFTGKKSKKIRHLIWLASCWSIWLTRNNLIFKGEEPDLDSIVYHIKTMSWSWFIYGVGSHSGYVLDSWWNNAYHCINHFVG